MSKIKVLFCCMGNICRSPLAHGYFAHLVAQHGLNESIEVDSAGTHAYHVGNPPDPRSQQTALRHGIDISTQRARQASSDDLREFDFVIAMDNENLTLLRQRCPAGHEAKITLFMDHAPQRGEREVPDPYYGGAEGFEQVFDMVQEAAHGLLARVREQLATRAE
jgi:protein-tyrosine phosphatase